MKKRILSLLLAVSIACSMLVVPANAAASNAAVQTAVTLGGLTSEQASALSTALTRGQLAKLLVAFSAYRESAATQGNTGTLFTDVRLLDRLLAVLVFPFWIWGPALALAVWGYALARRSPAAGAV